MKTGEPSWAKVAKQVLGKKAVHNHGDGSGGQFALVTPCREQVDFSRGGPVQANSHISLALPRRLRCIYHRRCRVDIAMSVIPNSMISLSLALLVFGCMLILAKETRYLLSATDRATQDEVRQHLGPPFKVTTDKEGKTVWIYEIREFVQGGNISYEITGSWWCDEYILYFDPHGVLRNWTHKSQKCS